MDDDNHVVIIKQLDGSMLETQLRVARNGRAVRVRSNGEGSKPVSSPVDAVKFKKPQ